jgi:putative ATPase
MRAYVAAVEDVQQTLHQPVPLHLRNASTSLTKGMGFGRGYRYAHDETDAIVDQQHLPDQLRDHHYYAPTEHGAEAQIAARLAVIREALDRRRPTQRDTRAAGADPLSFAADLREDDPPPAAPGGPPMFGVD